VAPVLLTQQVQGQQKIGQQKQLVKLMAQSIQLKSTLLAHRPEAQQDQQKIGLPILAAQLTVHNTPQSIGQNRRLLVLIT